MPADLNSILKLEVPVIVRIGERDMEIADVVGLAPGSIVELPKSADEELELLINNKRVGSGTAVKVGENYGIRITMVGEVGERIAAMGPDADEESPSDLADQFLGAQ